MSITLADLLKSSESGRWKDLREFYDAYAAFNAPLQDGVASLDHTTQQRRHGHNVAYEGVDGQFTQSWFVVCRSSDVGIGQVIGRGFLDGQVAIFRGESGKISVVSAYCPHVGAHLGCGNVVGDEIECAFHRWRFDASGRCTKTGCGDPVPPAARVFKFPTEERFGLIWAFNGETPTWALPDMGALDDELVFLSDVPAIDFNCDPWIIMANTLDWNHLKTVHGLDVEIAQNSLEWAPHRVTMKLDTTAPPGVPFRIELGIFGTSVFWQHGFLGDRWFSYIAACGIQRPGTCRVYIVIAARRGDGSSEALQAAQETIRFGLETELFLISQDMPILNFCRFTKGMLTRSDRQLGRFVDHVRNFPRAHPSAAFIR